MWNFLKRYPLGWVALAPITTKCLVLHTLYGQLQISMNFKHIFLLPSLDPALFSCLALLFFDWISLTLPKEPMHLQFRFHTWYYLPQLLYSSMISGLTDYIFLTFPGMYLSVWLESSQLSKTFPRALTVSWLSCWIAWAQDTHTHSHTY